jgi:hypothetical protein
MPLTRATRKAFTALIIFGLACSSYPREYSPQRDDSAMQAIASRWSESGAQGYVFSLCEDTQRALAEPADDCQVEHVIRGRGLGRQHTVDSSSEPGCGGCPFANVAYVTGTLSGGGLAAPVRVTGEVHAGEELNVYGYPYFMDLHCEAGAAEPCFITATLKSDGTLELSASMGSRAAEVQDRPLVRRAAATCP